MKKYLVLLSFLCLSASVQAQTSFITAKWGGLGTVGTSWDTLTVANTSTKVHIFLMNESATATDTLFFAFNNRLNDTTATKTVHLLLPGETYSETVQITTFNQKGKQAAQKRRLQITTGVQ